jgi:serine phosphatase RsbU (regulator of sigma subunit)
MADDKQPRYLVFKLLLVVGGILGVLLLVQAVRSYDYISDRMVHEELYRDSARQISEIIGEAREVGVERPEDLGPVLEKVLREKSFEIAWVRIFNLRGQVYARAGLATATPFTEDELRRLFDAGERVVQTSDTDAGRVLINVRPFRYRWERRRQESPQPPPDRPDADRRGGGGGPILVEIALFWDSAHPIFGGLRRAILLEIMGAVALLAAMLFIGLRFQNFLRGKQLEQQLELARTVQQDLLPHDPKAHDNLDVSAICEPAWQVGGDFYDIFTSPGGRVSMILGDVSGKGLPAALLMGTLHGAVRSSLSLMDPVDLENASRHLNQLICNGTAAERFVTMFWCQYDPEEQLLRYVNAGHLAPYVVHNHESGEPTFCRLTEGGPVLGVIPSACYEQGVVPFRPGDTLVLYSDGVVEAENRQDDEFGEERLAAIIDQHATRPAIVLRDAILSEVRKFSHGAPQADDLTLLVVRAGAPVGPNDRAERAELQLA